MVRSSGTRPACSIWSSCTVHSTSESPPRPSLKFVAGSAPRGSRSESTRALIRRTSITSSWVSPSSGNRSGSISVLEPLAQVRVTDDRRGTQQRLRLPHRRPLAVVGGVGVEAPDQRTLLALGSQAGVHLERRVARLLGEQLADVVGHRLRHRRSQLRVGTGQRLVHEHHVGVAAVAELVAAVATHRDDRHPGRHLLALGGLDAADRRSQGRVERRAGDVGQRVADLGHPERHAQVGHADPQQLPAPDGPDRQHRVLRRCPAARPQPSSRSAPPRGSAARAARPRRGSRRPRARAGAGRWRSGWSRAPAPSAGPPHPRRAAAGGTTASRPAPRRSCGSRTGRRPGRVRPRTTRA